MFIIPTVSSRAGVWICTKDNHKTMFTETDIAYIYLGHSYYKDGIPIKVHAHRNYDYLTIEMFTGIGLSSSVHETIIKKSKQPSTRLVPYLVDNDFDMAVSMDKNAPSIGYVTAMPNYYNVFNCLTKDTGKIPFTNK